MYIVLSEKGNKILSVEVVEKLDFVPQAETLGGIQVFPQLKASNRGTKATPVQEGFSILLPKGPQISHSFRHR